MKVRPVTIKVDTYAMSFGLRMAIQGRMMELQNLIQVLPEMTTDEKEELAELERVFADLQNWV